MPKTFPEDRTLSAPAQWISLTRRIQVGSCYLQNIFPIITKKLCVCRGCTVALHTMNWALLLSFVDVLDSMLLLFVDLHVLLIKHCCKKMLYYQKYLHSHNTWESLSVPKALSLSSKMNPQSFTLTVWHIWNKNMARNRVFNKTKCRFLVIFNKTNWLNPLGILWNVKSVHCI